MVRSVLEEAIALGFHKPVSGHRRRMGAGAWDALGRSPPHRQRIAAAASNAPVIHKRARPARRPMDSGICDPAWLMRRESQSPF
jgi:hypothetical protein